MKMLRFNIKYALLTLSIFLIELYIGLYVHDAYIRPYGGDFLIAILIYCFVRTFLQSPLFITTAGVLLFCYAVEISQYFHLINLLGLEKSKVARLILGTSFSWTDMLMYTLGIILVVMVELLFASKNK
jgi:hypothetical protein